MKTEQPRHSVVKTEQPRHSVKTEQLRHSVVKTEQPCHSVVKTEQPRHSVVKTEGEVSVCTHCVHAAHTHNYCTRARSHANRVSGVDSTSLREAHPGVLSDSLTECITHCVCHSECELCLFVLPALPQVNSTNIPATTPATSFTPHHSCELLPCSTLATHPPHHTINFTYTFPHYRNLA